MVESNKILLIEYFEEVDKLLEELKKESNIKKEKYQKFCDKVKKIKQDGSKLMENVDIHDGILIALSSCDIEDEFIKYQMRNISEFEFKNKNI
jgi:predicted nuclease with TOPRIM domain